MPGQAICRGRGMTGQDVTFPPMSKVSLREAEPGSSSGETTALIEDLKMRKSLGVPRIVANTFGDFGAVAAGSPHAVRVGLDLLNAGGTAGDAATGMAFAMMVADPANCSPAGRAHVLYRTCSGPATAIDGTTRAPSAIPTGAAPIPLPGCTSAILELHAKTGRLPLETVLDPVISLAENGFEVPDELAQVWANRAGDLKDVDARSWYLPSGHPPRVGETFVHKGLARFFRNVSAKTRDPFTDQTFFAEMALRIESKGGVWQPDDVLRIAARDGEVVRLANAGWELVSIGRQGWGHTLLQIVALNQWAARSLTGETDLELAQLLAISQAFDDRPQYLRSLKPKSKPLAYEDLVDRAIIPEAHGWRDLRAVVSDTQKMKDLNGWLPFLDIAPRSPAAEERDTTHLSAVDKDGLQVSLTQSIGPHFGARIADPEYGILLAHSYRMEFDPEPCVEDVTEQCPALLTVGSTQYAVGGAGSERIPGAVASVVRHLLAGAPLSDAICKPRANWVGPVVRLHADIPSALRDKLNKANIPAEETDRGPIDHIGIVHAVGWSPEGKFEAAADPAYAGAAGVC
ncbi:MAG: gamma-glutamyltransferase family protein [Roseibium sp.]|uniref:gamma-glutamyltransferase n=1 Tax=Roseibium sp. TaxID=1936156 RepID=UPI002617E58D|nr:gamma-glutamyltransferase [Roseibium sp.]MCV0429894.1 gamma-glutamyltransferase family protein [Roseibium sp.]